MEVRYGILCFRAVSQWLWDVLAKWCNWLANKLPPWVTYHALMACHLVVIDKCPGMQLVEVCDIFCHMWTKMVVQAV